MQPDAQTHQALSLLQQAFDALEATSDSDIDTFEDELEEAQAVPAQYACRKIIEAMGLLRGAVAPAEPDLTRFRIDMDGSMEPDEYGPWVRYEDVARA
jgi:hypothetical protein